MKSILLSGSGPSWEKSTSEFVCAESSRFEDLMECLFSGDPQLAHRATLIVLQVSKRQPEWLEPQTPKMVESLDTGLSDWHKRNLLRILQYLEIPKSHWGHAADQCFKYLSSPEETVAVKVFSMSVLYNLVQELPELAGELRFLIEEQYPTGSPGFRARGRKVLGQLKKAGH